MFLFFVKDVLKKMKSYLVPTDFTSASENSLQLAIDLIQKNGGEIHLLNFCELESELEATAHAGDIWI